MASRGHEPLGRDRRPRLPRPPGRRRATGTRPAVAYLAAQLAVDGRPEQESAELARRIVLLTGSAIVTALREGTAAAWAIAAALPADPCAETVGRG
ncbi:hypothetical protein [Kitasatospora griseola]|uniref:hypothetical protein n=1 Tax=Kitasatospora griseola TaxID=2064 RepID=UPI00128B4EB8|nr:hypothetical protein [Kitasatospora griseola]